MNKKSKNPSESLPEDFVKAREFLEENKGSLRVVSHGDADGIYSAVLLSSAYAIQEIQFPDTFGDCEMEDGMANVSLDFGEPLQKEFSGLCIDHHDHPNPWYTLVERPYPTGLIVYELLKDKIPPTSLFKVAGSLMGDGQSELIPPEVWEKCPELRDGSGKTSIRYDQGREPRVWTLPCYRLLSSPINALSNIGSPYQAYLIAKDAKEPLDVIENPQCNQAQDDLRKYTNDLLKSSKVREINGVVFVPLDSKVKVASRIATAIQSNDFPQRTFVVYNEETKTFSIRGDLTMFLIVNLLKEGIEAGGHPKFGAGSLGPNQEGNDLYRAIRKIMRRL